MSEELVASITLDDLPHDLNLPFDDTAATDHLLVSPERQRIDPQESWCLDQYSGGHLDVGSSQYACQASAGILLPISPTMPELCYPVIAPDVEPYHQYSFSMTRRQSQYSQNDSMIQSDPLNSPWYPSRSADLLDQTSTLGPPVPAQSQGDSLDLGMQHDGTPFIQRTMDLSDAFVGTLHDPSQARIVQPQWPTVGVSGFISGNDVMSGPLDDASQHSLLRLQYDASSVVDTASFVLVPSVSYGAMRSSSPVNFPGGSNSQAKKGPRKGPKSAAAPLSHPLAEPIPYCTLRLLAEWMERLESKTVVPESVEKRLATLLKASTRRFLDLYCLRDFEEWARTKAGLAENPAIRICGYCYHTYGQFYPTRSNNYEEACECHQVKSLYFQKHAQVYRDAGKSTWRPIHPPQDVQGSEATVLSECDLGDCTVYT
ncbi:hypothetical protein FFLO_04169 [Filobasidium floriforme]|uniref:Uncharacterized protein n=1 Tax=Filobasidium floriforme TaxID=5210 RepID=A0A8K0NQ67_9TREE|nr:uncharacterized protein HD553DRAFT_323532 [Filobasidium floriforme]KAG7531727.1 hypothetical protein FFLO_04169 [Filobasidium floriforme]KAH8085671.1 hypothetical protein HD553DRAFT_323532 [Filobasidium floriforme]